MHKDSYIDMRHMMQNMRNAQKGIIRETSNTSKETIIKQPTTRDLLGKMRKLKEAAEQEEIGLGNNKKTDYDQQIEEKKMSEDFKDLNVNLEFEELEVYDKGVFWGGNIDGQVQWVYKVTPDEITSGFEINHVPDFDINNEDNKKMMDKIEDYYDTFYKYWRNNIIQKI